MRRARLPRGVGRLAVAAVGAGAVAFGLVALVTGRPGGITIVLGGIVLVGWSMLTPRP